MPRQAVAVETITGWHNLIHGGSAARALHKVIALSCCDAMSFVPVTGDLFIQSRHWKCSGSFLPNVPRAHARLLGQTTRFCGDALQSICISFVPELLSWRRCSASLNCASPMLCTVSNASFQVDSLESRAVQALPGPHLSICGLAAGAVRMFWKIRACNGAFDVFVVRCFKACLGDWHYLQSVNFVLYFSPASPSASWYASLRYGITSISTGATFFISRKCLRRQKVRRLAKPLRRPLSAPASDIARALWCQLLFRVSGKQLVVIFASLSTNK